MKVGLGYGPPLSPREPRCNRAQMVECKVTSKFRGHNFVPRRADSAIVRAYSTIVRTNKTRVLACRTIVRVYSTIL